MALHFVSTSVLSAKDNGEYTEELKDNDEVLKEKVSASKSVGKPLFEQLAEQAMKKQADYDANTKLIFAPPRALDADDLRYYENLSEIKEKEILTRKANEDKEVELFLKAQHRQDRGGGHDGEHQAVTTAESSSSGSLFYSKHDDRSKKAANAPKIEIVKHKRKQSNPSSATGTKNSEKKTKTEQCESPPVPAAGVSASLSIPVPLVSAPSPSVAKPSSNSLSALLGQYDSDEESS